MKTHCAEQCALIRTARNKGIPKLIWQEKCDSDNKLAAAANSINLIIVPVQIIEQFVIVICSDVKNRKHSRIRKRFSTEFSIKIGFCVPLTRFHDNYALRKQII